MFELVKAGGWLMLPIIICSIVAVAICIERYFVLNAKTIAPPNLLAEVWGWIKNNQLDAARIRQLKTTSPLGRILAAGLGNSHHGRDAMKESIQEAASQVVHDLERYLNALGTIAAVTPLLGLLGTVIGMIKVFTEIMLQGTGNAAVFAGGISEALITTAAGIGVAIPALMMHRFYSGKIDSVIVTLEQQAIKLVDALHGDRKIDSKPS
ncbi:MotA/TolQ/ExbB proton channel family protein [uncultured Oceanicoccus sp.]|uniref:MotA/TolQ/ExbB proton channel family protein n=1 Tax=uncultured Oceanicoccus sp. TaxID=1706381 RepID=UPI0030DA7D63